MTLLALLGALVFAPAAAPAAARPKVVEWSLANGLQVAYLRVTRMPVVAVQVWVHAGAKDDPEGKTGTARIFERLLFTGSEHVPAEQHARLIARVGGSAGAFTTDDVTVFHEVVPRGQLDLAVRLEADRLRRLMFRPKAVAAEKELAKEGLRARDPYGDGGGGDGEAVRAAVQRLRAVAFTVHPYRRATAGSLEDLDRISADDLRRFYDLYYQPGNVLLVIVGDVPEEESRTAVDQAFGPIAQAPEPPHPAREMKEPPQTELRRETGRAGALGVVIGGWKVPEARSADLIPLEVAMAILATGDSARLPQRVVRKDKLAVGVGAGLLRSEDAGLLYVYATHLAPEQADRLETALYAEAERLGRERVSTRELERARQKLATRVAFAQGDVAALARQIGESKLLRGDATAWTGDLDAILKVTAADVQRVAKAYLQKTQLTIVRVPPRGGR